MKKKNNDQIILELKKQVEAKKKLLKSTEKFNPKTNCNLETSTGIRHNINTLSKNQVLSLIAMLQSQKTALSQVFPEETLEISGFSVDLWIDDLKSKFNTLNRKLEEERLKYLEDKLHNLLSVDKKVELEIEDLKNQI
jgi:hypothetical protein